MQPVIRRGDGQAAFQENAVVRFLLDWASQRDMNLNTLAILPFPRDDYEQFYQLIGYTIGGYSEMSFVSEESYAKAAAEEKKLKP